MIKKNLTTPPKHLEWFEGELDKYDFSSDAVQKFYESEIDSIISLPRLSELSHLAKEFGRDRQAQLHIYYAFYKFLDKKVTDMPKNLLDIYSRLIDCDWTYPEMYSSGISTIKQAIERLKNLKWEDVYKTYKELLKNNPDKKFYLVVNFDGSIVLEYFHSREQEIRLVADCRFNGHEAVFDTVVEDMIERLESVLLMHSEV